MNSFWSELTPGGIGIWVLVFGLAGAIVKVWPMLKKLSNERDAAEDATRTGDMADICFVRSRVRTMLPTFVR
jgi:hypothetical protein